MRNLIYYLFYFGSGIQYRLRKRITPTGFKLLVYLLLSGLLGMETSKSLNYQIFTFVFSVMTIAIAYSLFFRFHFSATRILPRFTTVGTKLRYPITIQQKTDKIQSGLKLWEDFVDPRPTFGEFEKTPALLQRQSFSIILGIYARWRWLVDRKQRASAKIIDLPTLTPKGKTEVFMEITPTHRGVVKLSGLTVLRLDPLGLCCACAHISLPQSFLVLPRLYKLPPIQLPGGRRYQSGGIAASLSVGDAEEFRSLREYRPGDSLRKIHWKSWAKIGKPIVKEEQEEFFVRHALILDTFQNVPYSEILEEAIAIAATLAWDVQTQESLLDLMFVGHEAYCFTFGRGLSHTDKMLEILASIEPCQHKYFESIMSTVMERISLLSGCICILISWDEERKKLIDYLRKMGIHTLVIIVVNANHNLQNMYPELINDQLTSFHILTLGKIQEQLCKI